MKQGQPCLCHSAIYHNSFFANPEGRSFQCFIPMPFKKGARIQITNESGKRLSHIFYDINFDKITVWNNDYLYFHSYWNRDTATTLAKDFELLPAVKGKGRFLGVNIGVNTNPVYKDHWWGEGEVGTAWEQGVFYNDYAGCLLANKDTAGWAFCRYHVPDPIYFKSGCSITLQQIGATAKKK